MLAAGHAFDSGGDGLIAFVHIIRCHNRNSPARLIHTNGDGLAVIQSDRQRIGDVSHRCTVFIHKAGGVDDIAAFTDGGGGGQNYINLVDGVVDSGGRTVACDFQFFEVAASGFGDLDRLGALVDEHIIGRRRNSHGADSIARLDGDARTVVEFQRYVSARFIGKRSGVSDLATFINGAWRSQRNGSGVVGAGSIGDGGVHRRSARYQVFEMLAAGHAFDGGGDSLVAFVHVIWSYGGNATAGLVHTNGDGLAVVQGDGQRIGDVSHRRAIFIHKAGGVDDIAAFTDSGGGGQDYINFVDGVVDRGGCAVACDFQFFEVAARSVSDLDRLGALVDEHVIGRRRDGHCTNGVAGLDGNGRAVIQFQGDVSTGLVAQGRGVGDLSTFVNSAWRSQRDSRCVIGARCVGNGGVHRRSARYQVFEMLAAGHAFDSGGDGLIAFVHIIRCHNRNSPARLIHTNGDGLAVIQSDRQRIGDVSHRCTVFIHKAGGVDDIAAFTDGGGGGQNYINLVDGVVDSGGRTVACDFQFFEVAASGFGDLDRLGALVDEHIIGRRRNSHGADSIARLDGDARTVVEFQRYVSARFIGKRSGVSDLATFINGAWRSQRNGSGVVGAGSIGDGGVHRRSAWHQVFEMLAAGHAFDGGGDSLVAFVHVIWSYGGNATAGLVHTDSDGLAVVQGDGQRVGDVSHRCTVFIHKAGGVDDIAAFADSCCGGQDYIDLVDGVVDRGGSAVARNFQFFEVAARSVSDFDGLGALIDEHVIGRCRDGHSANGIASLDGNGRAVIQFQRNVSTGLVA